MLYSNDPAETLTIVLQEAQQLEKTLKQCVEIGSFFIERNKELIADNIRMQAQIDNLNAAGSSVSTVQRDYAEIIRQKDLIIQDLEAQKAWLSKELEETDAEMQN